MKVLHVSMAYPPATSSAGPIQQLHALVRATRDLGVDARVITTDAGGAGRPDVPPNRWTEFEGVPVFYARCWNARYFLAPAAWGAIRDAAATADVVHVTQVWSWFTTAAAWHAWRTGTPIVFAPCGGFDPSARAVRAGKKALFNAMGGRWAVRTASGVRATSQRERDAIEAYVPGVPTIVIPNVLILPPSDILAPRAGPDAGRRSVLFLGRLHPIKNLPVLLRAWAALRDRPEGAHIVLAGPDERGHRKELEGLAAELGIASEVRFVGNVPPSEIPGVLSSAWCVVLPSKTENFGNVVAEALACATPVIASTGTPWSSLAERGCGWWVKAEPAALGAAIRDALALPVEERRMMGERGRTFVREEFDVRTLARTLCAWHESIVREGRPGER